MKTILGFDTKVITECALHSEQLKNILQKYKPTYSLLIVSKVKEEAVNVLMTKYRKKDDESKKLVEKCIKGLKITVCASRKMDEISGKKLAEKYSGKIDENDGCIIAGYKRLHVSKIVSSDMNFRKVAKKEGIKCLPLEKLLLTD